MTAPPAKLVVAIPARDEQERLAACLNALDAQTGQRADHILLLLNNCTDSSAAIARQLRPRLRTDLRIHTANLPPDRSNAGHARRLAMEAAMDLAGPDGVLMTTDADGCVDPDWITRNLDALHAGADLVAGWAELDPDDWGAIPLALHQDDARECAYDTTCDELIALLDPNPADPLPRHTQASGASLAVTVAAYRAAGGIPDVGCGEDRAFVAALQRIDARIRHAPECHVTVSGRTTGRAIGGMADTISRRLTAPDPFLDDRLEPAAACARRAALRHFARAVFLGHHGQARLARLTAIPADTLAAILASRHFGAAWAAIEHASPTLARGRVATHALPVEQAAADALLRQARANAGLLLNTLLDEYDPACPEDTLG